MLRKGLVLRSLLITFRLFSIYACLHVCLCTICMQCPWTSEDGVRSPGTGFTGGCELSCGCWDPNLGPLQEQQVVLALGSVFQPQEWVLSSTAHVLILLRAAVWEHLPSSLQASWVPLPYTPCRNLSALVGQPGTPGFSLSLSGVFQTITFLKIY